MKFSHVENLLDIQLDYFSESSISPKSSSPQLRDRYSNNIPVFFQERDERSRSSRALSAIGLDTVSSQNLRKTSLGRTSFDIFKNKRNSIQQRSSFEKKVHIEEYNRLIRSQHKEKLKCERRVI